jgi:hypothetical protein
MTKHNGIDKAHTINSRHQFPATPLSNSGKVAIDSNMDQQIIVSSESFPIWLIQTSGMYEHIHMHQHLLEFGHSELLRQQFV